LTFQWKRNSTVIPDATNATYTTSAVSLADNGANFSCVLSSGTFTAESASAYLAVINTASRYPQAVLADNPIVYYRLEELGGGIAFDSSSHGYNGIYVNVDHQLSARPELGSSASFHGPSSPGNISVPALVNPASSDNYFSRVTAEVWVKLNS